MASVTVQVKRSGTSTAPRVSTSTVRPGWTPEAVAPPVPNWRLPLRVSKVTVTKIVAALVARVGHVEGGLGVAELVPAAVGDLDVIPHVVVEAEVGVEVLDGVGGLVDRVEA